MSGSIRDRLRRFTTSVEQSDDLSPAQRAAILNGYEEALGTEGPPRLVLIGEAGVGKSTTVNALFNAGQAVGHSRATTDRAWTIPVQEVSGSNGTLEVVDMPGLGDDIANYRRYLALYREVLPTADAIVWIHPAKDRMVHLVQQALADIFGPSPELVGRLVFGLNKADEMGPHDWNAHANLPSEQQRAALRDREEDFTRRIARVLPGWRGRAVSYAALRFYNLTALFKEMMYAVPEQRRWVLEQRMALADFTTLVDRKLLRAATATTLAEVPAGDPEPPAPPQPVRDQWQPSGPNPSGSVADALAALSDAQWRDLYSDRSRFEEFVRRVERGNGR
ncbi:GTPase [Streptomyces sp. Li-HN-5-11]|jgi:predicted GTPase|uniref:GTPase family protein n=1 Tax=Streptomyces sp. Li-HN-5-11 TaxID=3075432 RepID=UPI0028B04B88|nr:GTPase [Streptomyces sp. Li-HN-5-11]WNM30724.1 GTPase [Streptomyces sp. Li-HN-5-11]